MAIQILNDEQRRSYARFDGNPSPDQIARYFHLDFTDRAIIQNLRGDHSRLGFALMLGGARFLGAFPDESNNLPEAVLSALSHQLGLESEITLAGYFGSRQRIRHLSLIRETYGFVDFALAPRALSSDALALCLVL